METQQSIMGKTPSTGGTATSKPKSTERRGSRRCKITQLMLIRPSDPEREHFDDMRGTLSVSRSGVYFQTSEAGYEIGMRLFVTLPYSQDPMAMNREYLAEVVRRDPLSTGMFGVGLKILMEMGMQQPAAYRMTNSPW
jgi:PilZ domain